MKIEELVLMRIFVGENDRFERKPLYQALVDCFKENGLAGATVTKAVMGYGGHSEIHTDHLLRLSSELPVVIETVDTQEKIDVVLPLIEKMFQGGLITMETVRAVRFKPESVSS